MTSKEHIMASDRVSEAAEKKLLDKGDNVLLSTFGAGYSWGAMYIKWGISAHA